MEKRADDYGTIREQRRSLPIFKVRKSLKRLLKNENCIVLKGETACGKTTQVPQYILESGLANDGAIAITQPRRIAAISIAKRVAKEVGTNVGHTVGYAVRFDDATSSATKIKYVTDGKLLRECISDRLLLSYSWIIIDEAHERTINTDILFGVVKSAQRRRQKRGLSPLKLVIMSATLDEGKLVTYFNNPKVVSVAGREYRIVIHNFVGERYDYVMMALTTVIHIHTNYENGDILVFLTGEEEIESAVSEIRKVLVEIPDKGIELFPCSLYASLPQVIQENVLKPSPPSIRKVIFSTNIAETSLTIPGIKYVIDSGMVKSKFFNSSGFDLLKVHEISQAQADQRCGRAGRERFGHCFRLYTLEEFNTFQEFSIPEIERCSLTSVILQIAGIGITNVANFKFLDRPSDENINFAVEQLQNLGAVEGSAQHLILTEIGKKMISFPLDPRFSKMVITAPNFNCTDEILIIIALLSVESVFFSTIHDKERFQKVRKRFSNGEGDHIMLLNLFKAYQASNADETWCANNFVNCKNLTKAKAICKQLRDICQNVGISLRSCANDTSLVKRCLATGLFMNSAHLYRKDVYKTVSNDIVFIHPSSSMCKSTVSCCVYTDLIETSKKYMRNVTVVDADWLIDAAPEYFKTHKFSRFELMDA